VEVALLPGGGPRAVLMLQRAAGNAAVSRLLRPPPASGRHPVVVQRLVERGLALGTRVVSARHGEGTIRAETARGYQVEFMTRAAPSIPYGLVIPFAELDPVGAEEESSEEPVHDVLLSELPASVTVSGVTLDDWKGGGDNFVLAPTGAQYPHLTISGHRDELAHLHFTSAEPRGANVSVIRRGYRWNGMTSRLVVDPLFDQSEQLLPVKSRTATHVTFDLSGGRQNQQVALGAHHVAVPSVAELGTALQVPH
jgi:hypothetical protein